MTPAEQDPDQLRGLNFDETQTRSDGDGPQSRSAVNGPGARNSGAVAGNNISNSSTGRGDIVGGNKSGHNINLGAVAVIAGLIIGALFLGKTVIQVASAPSPSSITKESTCSDYAEIEDSSARLAIINRIATQTGNRGVIGSPILLSEVDAKCDSSSSANLGSIVSHAKGY